LSLLVLAAITAVAPSAAAQSIGSDDFEGGAIGSLPLCPWLDVALVDPTPPNPPSPSASVVSTLGPSGRSTQALSTVDAIAPSQGIYALVPVSSVYSVSADVRVDRFSDNPVAPTQDWAMQIGVGKLDGSTDLAFTPQVGIYASAFTQSWRLYAVGNSYLAAADIELGVTVEIGVWYRVQVDLIAATGEARSRVWNAATDTLLVDQTDTIPLWTPADGIFDRLMVMDGEVGGDATISNLATVDNVAFSSAPAKTPGPQGDLNGDLKVDAADLAILLGNWTP
jgi:hypothetical protein